MTEERLFEIVAHLEKVLDEHSSLTYRLELAFGRKGERSREDIETGELMLRELWRDYFTSNRKLEYHLASSLRRGLIAEYKLDAAIKFLEQGDSPSAPPQTDIP